MYSHDGAKGARISNAARIEVMRAVLAMTGDGVTASREKAVGIYAGGLLLQLPVPGARFCCNSMEQVSPDTVNETLTCSRVANDFCAISSEITRSVHPMEIDSVIPSRT